MASASVVAAPSPDIFRDDVAVLWTRQGRCDMADGALSTAATDPTYQGGFAPSSGPTPALSAGASYMQRLLLSGADPQTAALYGGSGGVLGDPRYIDQIGQE